MPILTSSACSQVSNLKAVSVEMCCMCISHYKKKKQVCSIKIYNRLITRDKLMIEQHRIQLGFAS